MKNRKLNQLLVAGMISAAMMTSGISVQAADFSDDTSTVEEQSVGSAEEEAPEVEDGSEFQSDAAEASSAVAVSSANFPDAKFRQYILDNIDTDKDKKLSAAEIKRILEEQKFNSSIYIMVDTLKYLKKGGRITPAAAMIGTVLNIKPVLTIQGEKLDAFEKARGIKQAKKGMIKAMKKDLEKRFAKECAAGIMGLQIAYTANDQEVIDGWISEVKEAFPDFEVDAHPLSLSIACHIGPGAIALACEKKSAIS